MKNITRLLLGSALLASLASLHGQVQLDPLTSTTSWEPADSFEGFGDLAVGNGEVQYTVSSPGFESNYTYRKFTGITGSYTSNWTVRIDVNYGTPSGMFDAGVGQAINTGLLVARSDTALALNETTGDTLFAGFMVASNLYWDGSNASRDFRPSRFFYDIEAPDNESRYAEGAVSSSSSGAILIGFNAATKTLFGMFDADGTGNGINFLAMNMTPMTDQMNAGDWGMNSSDTFSIYLVGNSMFDAESGNGIGPLLEAGDVTMTNFYGTSAIPEPSTYAAMFGAAVLGLAIWRRKQRAATA